MPRKSSIINDELINKCTIALKHQGNSGMLSKRLQAIISVKDHNISVVSSVFGVTRATLTKWIKDFDHQSIDGLLIKKGRGRKRVFNDREEEKIKKMIELDPNITGKSLQKIIEDQMHITVGIATIYRVMKSVGFSYITPRQNHYKQDKEKVVEFKKNSK
jgi:transposase